MELTTEAREPGCYGASMLKLYGHDTSPYVRRIRVLLAELGLPFVRDPRSWTVADADVLRLNPCLRVPALEAPRDGGGTQLLLDSRIIAAFLYAQPGRSPAPLADSQLPLAPTLFHDAARWDDENALSILDAAQDSLINLFVLELDGITPAQSPYLQRQYARVQSCLGWLDARLGDHALFHADRFSYLDIALACSLDWAQFRDRYPVRQHRNIARALDLHAERPSLSTTHPRLAANAALPKAGK